MKRFFYILILLFSVNMAFGQPVSKEQAVRVASHFLYQSERPVKQIDFYNRDETSGMYVVNFEPEGWALVAENENAKPVIGYSYTGSFDVENVSSNVKNWLDDISRQIVSANKNSLWTEEWNTLKERGLPVLKSALAVEPLLQTKWDQDAGWNRFCPPYANGPDGKAYVGCVAVAMAQALHHIKYPEQPSGQKSYPLEPYGTISLDFDQEPAYEWSKMALTSPDDYNARLLYHCAVAAEMDFGGDGSGAYTHRVPFAFQRYFSFTPAVQTLSRYEDETQWTTLLKSELDKGNVLIYSGNPNTGAAGHAFNIDGYSASGYFHFNWGWSGSYNGYFTVNDITPGSNDFNYNQQAVVGISEPYWGPTDIALSNQSIKENMPAGTVVGDITITDYSENDQFTIEVFGAPLFMQDGYADAKFYAENMQLKSLEPLVAGPYPETATIRVKDRDGNELEKTFEVEVRKATSSPSLASGNIVVYPNPAKDVLYLKGLNELDYYRIINIAGKTVVHSEKYNGKIDLSLVPDGIYFFEYAGPGGDRSVQKIVVRK